MDEGSGPAVLLLHGFPDSSALWRKQIPALVDAGLRVIAPDLRGFGESDKPMEVEGEHHPEYVPGDRFPLLTRVVAPAIRQTARLAVYGFQQLPLVLKTK